MKAFKKNNKHYMLIILNTYQTALPKSLNQHMKEALLQHGRAPFTRAKRHLYGTRTITN